MNRKYDERNLFQILYKNVAFLTNCAALEFVTVNTEFP